jgi:hypothetical protein
MRRRDQTRRANGHRGRRRCLGSLDAPDRALADVRPLRCRHCVAVDDRQAAGRRRRLDRLSNGFRRGDRRSRIRRRRGGVSGRDSGCGLGNRRSRDGCRGGGLNGRRRRCGHRGRTRRRRRRSRVPHRQERERVAVAVRVGGDADAEMHVGLGKRAVARTDGADGLALGDGCALGDGDRAEMRERDRIAVGGGDRDRPARARHRARERDRSGCRRGNAGPLVAGDVDAAVLAPGVRVRRVEVELLQDVAARGPAPGLRHRRDEQRG